MTRRMTPAEVRMQARLMYEGDEAWPLMHWLNQWRERTIDCDASSVCQVVHAYSRLVNDNGPRAVDMGDIVERSIRRSEGSELGERRPRATNRVE